jgi:RES domain-containing protein
MSKAKPIDPPEVIELLQIIADLYATADGFDGVIIRNVGAKYSSKNDFYSGVGAAKAGGRWNRKGIEAIYASLDVQTATVEAYQDFIYRGLPLTDVTPRVTAGAKVKLEKVLDLTDSKILKKFGFTKKELVKEDWRALQKAGEESWTQAIGRGAYLARFEALIVSSARRNSGKNIVIFPKNVVATSTIDILGADQLPVS